MVSKEITLSDNSKIKVRPLSFMEKLPIKDIYYNLALDNNGKVPTFTICVTALTQIGITEQKLETMKDDDIFLAGNWILRNSELIEAEKKK